MKKIMFNDKYRLTQAVLEGRKTQTRRIMNPQPEDCSTVHRWYKSAYWKDKPMSLVVNEDGSVYCEFCGYGAKLEGGSIFRLPYKVGEIVAVAQSYKDCTEECIRETGLSVVTKPNLIKEAGYKNKMFVKADFMPHQIRITNVRAERLQDIQEDDCLKEGIYPYYYGDEKEKRFYEIPPNGYTFDGTDIHYSEPREAFAHLINKVSRKDVWEENPYVFVYDFELVK